MLQSPAAKQSLASSKQNLSCRDVFCALQINPLCDNVVQLPKPQDYICLPDYVAAGNNDLFACEIYITPRNPAPNGPCSSHNYKPLKISSLCPLRAASRRPGQSRNWTPAL